MRHMGILQAHGPENGLRLDENGLAVGIGQEGTAGARAAAGRGAARRGETMAQWVTISIPTELYKRAADLVRSGRAVSVSEFARLWISIGVRFDSIAQPDLEKVARALSEILREDSA